MNYTLKNEFYEMTVSTLGAEMISLKSKDGRELLWQNHLGEGWANHAPLLFPFCGRLKDGQFLYRGNAFPMKIHGFALRTEFEMAQTAKNSLTFVLRSNEETKEIYPFDFIFSATYALDGENITLSVKVENTGGELMPYVFGWHPGFALPTEAGQDIEDYRVKFKDKEAVTRVCFTSDLSVPGKLVSYPTPNSEYRLCEEEIYSHDTMVFRDVGHEAKLYAEGHPYELSMSWTDNINVLCIWKMPRNDAKYICIEPWTHTTARGEGCNDIEVRPMNRLEPGKTDSYAYTLKFTL